MKRQVEDLRHQAAHLKDKRHISLWDLINARKRHSSKLNTVFKVIKDGDYETQKYGAAIKEERYARADRDAAVANFAPIRKLERQTRRQLKSAEYYAGKLESAGIQVGAKAEFTLKTGKKVSGKVIMIHLKEGHIIIKPGFLREEQIISLNQVVNAHTI